MRLFRLVVLAFFLSTTSGCAYLTARSDGVAEKIDTLVEQQQYGRVQQILASVPASHPDYSHLSALPGEIEKLAETYQQQALIEGKRLEQQGQWLLARERYQQALRKLPDSEKLKAAQQALQLKQSAKEAALEFDLMMARGEWLKHNLVIQRELARITPSNWFREGRYEGVLREAKRLAEELGRHGARALEQGDLPRADRVSNLALQLYPGPAIEEIRQALVREQQALAQEQQALADQQRQSQEADQQRKQQAIVQSQKDVRQTIRASLQHALGQNSLSEALLIANQLEQLGELNTEEQQLMQQLARLVQQQVESDMNLGIEHYGQGDYQEAITLWRNVLALEPGNEQAADRIERAERILEKLQRLRDEKSK